MFIRSINDRINFAPETGSGSGDEEKVISVSESVAAAFDAHEKESDSNAGAAAGTAAATNNAVNKPDDKPADDANKDSQTSQVDKSKAGAANADNQPIAAPTSWDAESKAAFAKLPPELQKVVAKRESDRDGFVSKSGEELANYRKRYDALEQVLEPRKDHFNRMGMSPAQVVNQLLALADQADRDFSGFIKEQAKLRNFDVKTLVAAQGEQPYVDPAIARLQDEVNRLTGVINNGQQQQVQQVQNTIVQTITDFANEKDASGNLLRPHYSKLEADIEPFIIAIRRGNPNLQPKEVLQQAYDRVLWANPELRGELIEREKKAANDKLLEDERQKAQKASNAAVSHRGSPSAGSATATQNESVEDTVRNTLAAFGL